MGIYFFKKVGPLLVSLASQKSCDGCCSTVGVCWERLAFVALACEPSLFFLQRKKVEPKKWMIYIYIYPGSPKTKLCPLVVGNPLHGSSKRPFFVWSWTSRVYIYIYLFNYIYKLVGFGKQCLNSEVHIF